jgi:uncharacterized protein DUF4383
MLKACPRERAMSLRSHLRHHDSPADQAASGAAGPEAPPGQRTSADGEPDPRSPVFVVQRAGALAVGVFLLVFGVLGFAGGLDFFSTDGQQILGMSSNGLLSALSVVFGAVLIGADLRGPRVASTVMVVVGALFLLSALVNLAVLRTSFNILAFEMSNVIFSIIVGLVLLTLGAYGRFSGSLPSDSPYAHPRADEEEPESYPSTPEEFAAEAAMREAEIAVSNHAGTEDQRRRVQAMARVHTRGDRRRVWMEFGPEEVPEPAVSPEAHLTGGHPMLTRAAEMTRVRRSGSGRQSGK